MPYESAFPVVITPSLAEARDFYVQNLDFKVVFDSDWYLQLHAERSGGGPPIELAFMAPESRWAGFWPSYKGDGIAFTLQLEDVDALHEKLRRNGVDIAIEPRDEAWGQRHFYFRDPVGLIVDVVQQIEPSAEFLEAYTSPAGAH